MKKLITILEKETWKYYVGNSLQHDFYHTWHYHSLDNSGSPILFVYEENHRYIAFPLIKRRIIDAELLDLTSVYGYTGPIANQHFEDLDCVFLKGFKQSFLSFLQEDGYVSVFSRLHPFFNQHLLMKQFGGIHPNGKTVAIDLSMPIEEQRSKYHGHLGQKIRQLKRKGYIVKEVNSEVGILTFADIYMENMKRINASGHYLFTSSYFNDLYRSDEFNSKLLLVYLNDIAVCGAFIVCTNGIIQAHLLGTRTAYLSDSPAKLLTDEITLIGRNMGARYFHLGGGLNFKEDSLFEWKASFSDCILEFNSWRYIADADAYQALIQQQQLNLQSEVDFFPLYRYSPI